MMPVELDSDSAAVAPGGERAPILVPLGILFGATLLIRLLDWDHAVMDHYWVAAEQQWSLEGVGWVRFLYDYGNLPALIVIGLAGLGLGVASFKRRILGSTGLCVFLVTLMLLGPGLVVNSVFKDQFGRPRPRDTLAYGGTKAFLPVGTPNWGGEGRSFPSGHASMGFFWLGLFVYSWGRWRTVAWVWLGVGIVHGVLMGIGRIGVGAHWLSDVLWSAGFVYLVAWILARSLQRWGGRLRAEETE